METNEKPVPMCRRDTDGDGNCHVHRMGCPKPMTDERLKEIEARANAATTAPWRFEPHPEWSHHLGNIIAYYEPQVIRTVTIQTRYGTEQEREANAAFIANARQDVPDLVAEVRRLKDEEHKSINQLMADNGALQRAQDLLLERARQAEELLARTRELEWALHLLIGHHGESGSCANCKAANAILTETPEEALAIERARMAVVEAAREWASTTSKPERSRIDACARLVVTLDALEKLEAKP